jgi:hypothetical protein
MEMIRVQPIAEESDLVVDSGFEGPKTLFVHEVDENRADLAFLEGVRDFRKIDSLDEFQSRDFGDGSGEDQIIGTVRN